MKNNEESAFTPFWFESNHWFKMVNNEEDLEELFKVQAAVGYSKEQVLNAQECINQSRTVRKFGFTRECNSDSKLKAFLNHKI